MALFLVCTLVILGSTVFLGLVGMALIGEIRAVPDAVCARLKAQRDAEAIAVRGSR
jgi:hypothetical protein